MMFMEHFKTGVNSVKKNRFRSFFTMLGIIIGVVSVVTIISLGEGVKQQISGQVADLGDNLVSVRPGKVVKRDSAGKITGVNLFASTGVASLKEDDIKEITKLKDVESAVSMGTISGVPSIDKNKYTDGTIVVADPELLDVIDHEIEFGTYFNQEDTQKKTVVIGPRVAERLFNESVPIGKSLKIRGQDFAVQGIFRSFTEVPVTIGLNLNDAVFISQNSAKNLNGGPAPIYEILVKRKSETGSQEFINQISEAIKKNHDGQEDFTVIDQQDAGIASDELLKLLTRMIIGMAGVTLLIGGIGIMNVMLVSVSERNQEIGIRKAIGASNRQIRNQFIVESVILSVWGVVFGVVVSALLNIVLRIVTDLEPILTWEPIVFASLVSVGVGVLFGVIPAVKASKKEPIDCFRS